MWSALLQPRRSFLTFLNHGRKLASPLTRSASHPFIGSSSSFCSSRNSGDGRGNGSPPGKGVVRGTGLNDRRNRSGSGNPSGDRHGRRPRKVSFDDAVLKPAAKGELAQKHSSGIPRLAARKPKARLTPQPRHVAKDELNFALRDADSIWGDETDGEGQQVVTIGSLATSARPQPRKKLGYYSMKLIDDSMYYWREEEYEAFPVPDLPEDAYDDEGQYLIEYGDEDSDNEDSENEDSDDEDLDDEDLDDVDSVDHLLSDEDFDEFSESEDSNVETLDASDSNDEGFGGEDSNDEDFDDDDPEGSYHVGSRQYQDPEEDFFYNQNDIFHLASLDPEQVKSHEPESSLVMPLRPHGPELDDFLEAVMEHPTKYAQIESKRPHAESMREPKPFFPKDRLNPPLDFVNSHARFLYVAGLPSLEIDGELGDLKNPIHRSFLQRTVASLVRVDSSCVFPASTSSAFVGFASPAALAQALEMGPTEPVLFSPPIMSLWNKDVPSVWSDQGESAAIVQLFNIPPGNTGQSLRRALIPEGSEIEAVYGNVTPQDFYFQSPTSVLVRFASLEQAESAVQSRLLDERLQHLGKYVPRLFRARRELVHVGWEGPQQWREKRVIGPRLIVDGDMPPKRFFLSHAGVVHVRNLDLAVTREQLSQAFDPFSARWRDVAGSVEFVTCVAGLPTGSAYVGFDSPGEAEAAVRALSGALTLGGKRASLRVVQDRRVRGKPSVLPEKRGERSVEEILDDLDHWEKYVDPEDLKILDSAGINKVVLDEALRNIRYSNKTFGALDAAPRYDALEPDKSSGQLYRELVQLYISTLKECLPTPDNPGALYESTHFPDEPIDLSIFEYEEERQKKLLEKRSTP